MSTSLEPPAAPRRPSEFFRREILSHPVLYTVLAVQLAVLAWLLATPSAFRGPASELAAPTAPGMAVQVTDDAAIGGGLSAPAAPSAATPAPVAPMAVTPDPAAQIYASTASDGASVDAPGKDGKGKDRARAPKDGKAGKGGSGSRNGMAAIPAGGDLVVHLSLGGAGDALVGASSPAAATVELATAAGEPASEIPVRDGAATVRLGGLAQAIGKGGSVPLTLTFAEAGEVGLDVPVGRNARAAGAGDATPVAAGSALVERAWAEPAS